MISTNGITAMGSTSTSVKRLTGCAHREVRTHTAMSTKASLKSSEGCTLTEPMTTQRRAPDTVRPSTNTDARPARPSR